MTDGLACDNVKDSDSHQVYLGAASGLAGGAMHQQHYCHPEAYREETSLTNSQSLLTALPAASLNCCSAYYYEPETSTQHSSSGALPALPCLPTGNVTAVFVAVEGSDQLLQQCSSEDIRCGTEMLTAVSRYCAALPAYLVDNLLHIIVISY
jgi:hypothetical protein